MFCRCGGVDMEMIRECLRGKACRRTAARTLGRRRLEQMSPFAPGGNCHPDRRLQPERRDLRFYALHSPAGGKQVPPLRRAKAARLRSG